MEIQRHWRLRKERYSLIGEKRELEDGRVQYRLKGSWVDAPNNGHNQGENPLELPIHQVSGSPGGNNGRERLAIPASVDVYVASD